MGTATALTSLDVRRMVYYGMAEVVNAGFISRVATGPLPAINGQIKFAATAAARGMRELKLPRTTEDIDIVEMTVPAKKFEAGVRVRVEDMDRDLVGLIEGAIDEHISEPLANLWYEQSTLALESGELVKSASEPTVNFFSASHTRRKSGTQSNLTTSAIVAAAAPTALELEAALWASIGKFRMLKNDQGRPMAGQREFTWVVPPAWEKAAKQVVGSGYLTVGGTLVENALRLVVGGNDTAITLELNPFLLDDKAYYLLANDGKTLVLAEEHAPKYDQLVEGSDYAYNNLAHMYGVIASAGVALWRWESAQKHEFTTI